MTSRNAFQAVIASISALGPRLRGQHAPIVDAIASNLADDLRRTGLATMLRARRLEQRADFHLQRLGEPYAQKLLPRPRETFGELPVFTSLGLLGPPLLQNLHDQRVQRLPSINRGVPQGDVKRRRKSEHEPALLRIVGLFWRCHVTAITRAATP